MLHNLDPKKNHITNSKNPTLKDPLKLAFDLLPEHYRFEATKSLLQDNKLTNHIERGTENTVIVYIKDQPRIFPYKEVFFNTKKVVKYIDRHSRLET